MVSVTVWLIVGGIVGFLQAFAIGANDVANAFGTSVGSKVLTVRWAIILGSIFEFLGASLLGGSVSGSIVSSVVNPDEFSDDVFAEGMVATSASTALWLIIATLLGLPVSTTHSVIGALAGFGLAQAGTRGISWWPLGRIGISWIISPILGGLIGFVAFKGVLLAQLHVWPRPDRRAVMLTTVVGLTLCFYSITISLHVLPLIHLATVYIAAVAGFFLLAGLAGAWFGYLPWLMKTNPHNIYDDDKEHTSGEITQDDTETSSHLPAEDLDALSADKPLLGAESLRLPPKRSFRELQIVTACCVALAHGSNDVGNAVGPFYEIYRRAPGAQSKLPLWILVIAGAAIALGLALLGHRVMKTIGTKITHLSPIHGFCAEFAASVLVLICSELKLPISTTQILVGSVMGVGVAEHGIRAVQWRTLGNIAGSWLATLPFSCGVGALVSFILSRAIK